MKYKDFKMMSNDEMKGIKGGKNWYSCVCHGGNTPTFMCAYSSTAGLENCAAASWNFINSQCADPTEFTCGI